MMDDLEETKRLDLLRRQLIQRATKDVEQYVGKNIVVLDNLLNELCNALDNKQAAVAGKLSYQLSTMATLFDRPDYANMADFLCKILQNEDFTDQDGVCELFSGNFKDLSIAESYDSDLEQKVLHRTRNSLAKLRS